MTRRSLLVGAAAAAVVPLAPAVAGRPASASGGPAVQPREAWAGALQPVGPLAVEAPGDVRFLLVHHTAGPNEYAPGDVPAVLQGIYRFHTGPEKGWPDVAYNFFVDRYGGVWEGRAGSRLAPVIGDATGGNQGYSQLCCFLGTHADVPPTAEAQAAMVALLAWAADRYAIDTAPGATTSFVSRGSSRHPAGTTVTTSTIAGHRDMSATTCPGDAAYALVTGTFPQAVTAARQASATLPEPPASAAPPPPTTAAVPPSAPPTTATPPSTAPSTTSSSTPTTVRPVVATERAGSASGAAGSGPSLVGPAVGVTAAAVVVGGLVAWRRRAAGDEAGNTGLNDA